MENFIKMDSMLMSMSIMKESMSMEPKMDMESSRLLMKNILVISRITCTKDKDNWL